MPSAPSGAGGAAKRVSDGERATQPQGMSLRQNKHLCLFYDLSWCPNFDIPADAERAAAHEEVNLFPIEEGLQDGLPWTDAFLLGHAAMDRTHREFVAVVDELLRSDDAGLAGRLSAFIAHAEAHFGEEDRWMTESGFPPRDCHIDEHAAVLRSAHEVLPLVRAGDVLIGREFAAELARWFPSHADHLDSALSHWLVKKSHGGAPVVLRRDVLRASA